VRQAVSLWKAIQTWTWKIDEILSSDDQPSHSAGELIFKFDAIDHLLHRIEFHEIAWQQYFAACGIRPFTVVYEDLVLAYEATTIASSNNLIS
jgi:LPS sulfotransferase NodH